MRERVPERLRVKREPQRALYDRETIVAIHRDSHASGTIERVAGRVVVDYVNTVASRTAIENLVQQGVNTILITPSNSSGVLNAIKQARDKGILVVALDTQTEPASHSFSGFSIKH